MSRRVRVHLSFYYDTTEEKVAARPDYRESVKASLFDAIEQHAPSIAARVRKIEVRISRPHKS